MRDQALYTIRTLLIQYVTAHLPLGYIRSYDDGSYGYLIEKDGKVYPIGYASDRPNTSLSNLPLSDLAALAESNSKDLTCARECLDEEV